MLAAMSGLILKRKYEDVEEDPCYSSPSSLSSSAYSSWDSESESCYSDTLDSTPSNPSSPATHFRTTSILKKANRLRRERRTNVTFDQVTVFFFQHCQGFISVPSRGGCSLGMVQRHSALRTYTLAEFAAEQIVLRRKKLLDRLREEKLEALKLNLTKNGTQESEAAEHLTVDDIPEEELDLGTAGACLDDGSFLHPYSSKRRHMLLKAAGVKKIDKEEKRQLHELRVSREDCGCNCQGFCEPETCGCSLAGIKCQMDYSSFPCGCTKDGCGNTEGRIEFNSSRVQTHYIHTIMKLELEKRLEEHSGPEKEEMEGKLEVNGFQLDCSNHGYGHSCKPLGLPPQVHHSCQTVSLPTGISFHFSTELAAGGENSCSSDMTDSSSGSSAHEDSEAGERSPGEECFPLDVDESSLSRILRFSNADNEDCTVNCRGVTNCLNNKCHEKQQALQQSTTSLFGGLSSAEFPDENENIDAALLDSIDDHMGSRAATISELLDENANQGNGLFHSGSVPRPPSPSFDQSGSYGMDLSLSSESDLEFFDGFPCLGPSSLYNSLKEYEHMDNLFQFQMPSYPSLTWTSDPETCLLESLIGLSESVPEPPATFTDNQLLEDAFKLSVMESVKG